MPRELKISVGQHSDKGRKETNQDFHGVLIPERAAAQPEGHRHRAGRRHQQQQGQPGRQRVGGQGLPDRLLLHVGILVGEDLGAARAGGDQFLAALADPAQPVFLRQGPRLRLHAERHGASSRPPRIIFHIGDSRIYRVSGNSLEQLTNDHRVVISSEQSYLGRALGVNPQIEIDYQTLAVEQGDVFVLATDGIYEHVGDRAHRRGDQATAPTISTRPRRPIVEQAYRARQPGQSHRPDRPRRRIARRRRQRGVRAAARTAAAAAAGGAGGVRRLPDRPRTARHQPQPHLSRRRHRNRRRGHHQDPLDRPARRSRLPEALHDGGVGGAADRQPACAEALPAAAQAQFPLCRRPNTSTARR